MQNLRKRRLPQGWYPVGKTETIKEIENFSKGNLYGVLHNGKYGGIIPHAGWYYSGDLAAAVMRNLKGIEPELVILYGGHLPSGETPLITIEEGWETPLGRVKMAVESAIEIKGKFGLFEDVYPDNTLEIHLPLLKYYFPAAKLLALRLPPRKIYIG